MVHAVIMAGGSGTRFWPVSRKHKPKQFLNILGNRSMLQQTVDRLDGLVSPENIIVVTNQEYVAIVKEQLPGIPDESIIGEPVAKNTAPCIAAATALVQKRDPESVLVVLPADHRVGEPEKFSKTVQTAVEVAKNSERLITVGIKPSHPETGYGYIHYDKTSTGKYGSHPVLNFTEKPDIATAESFLKSGNYLWNSGMFIWKTAVFRKELSMFLPEIEKATLKLSQSSLSEDDISQFYKVCPSVSVDYGIMEKSDAVRVLPADFGWSDVGSWKAVYEFSEKDENGNATGNSEIEFVDASKNLVYSQSGKLISIVGVDGIGVIETEDSLLILKLDKSQDLKKVVENMQRDSEKKEFL